MTRRTHAILGALILLAGCGEPAPEPTAPMAMEEEAVAATAQTGKGTGTVTAVDAAAGSVTIAHEPMPDIGWSAMTMAFEADPALLAGVAAGDKVAFELSLEGGSGTVTALTRQ